MPLKARRKKNRMLDCNDTPALSARDLKLIQDALQTQEKILTLQSRAGGNSAKIKLNEIKDLMRRVGPGSTQQKCAARRGWLGFRRALSG